MLAPHARHHHVTAAQLCRELTRGSMRRAARSMALALQEARFQLRSQGRCDLASMLAVQARNALLGKPFAPAGHKSAKTHKCL